MDEALHNHELLTRYLDGELSSGERATLEERLRNDKQLQEQLTDLQVALQAIRHLGATEKVQAIHAEMMKELKGSQTAKVVPFTTKLRYALGIAASLLVLFVGVRLYLNAQLSPEKIYNTSFVDFNVSASRGNGTDLSAVENHYQQKAYDAVIADLRSAGLSAKDSLLIGLAYLHQNKPTQAIGFFQRLLTNPNDFQQDAEFYLSLSYVKDKAYDKALPLMQKIRNTPSHLYHEQISDETVENVKKLSQK